METGGGSEQVADRPWSAGAAGSRRLVGPSAARRSPRTLVLRRTLDHHTGLASGEAGVLLRWGFSARAVALAAELAAERSTTLIDELIRLGILDAAIWWQCVAEDLGVDCLEHLVLPVAPAEASLPEPRQFAAIRQVWLSDHAGRRLVVAPRGDEIDHIRAMIAGDPGMARRIAIAAPDLIRAAHRDSFAAAITDHAIASLHRRAPDQSAALAAALRRRAILAAGGLGTGLAIAPLTVLAILNLIFAATGFVRLAAVAAPTRRSIEIEADPRPLPTYAVLVPLYREAEVVADLVGSLLRLDYPPDRLTIVLVVETDDETTRAAATAAVATVPARCRISVIAVPPSRPRTKPKALNWALAVTDADLIVVYDAEDRPHPDQLRLAAEAFRTGSEDLVCVQAALDIDHASVSSTWLTRQFACEYAVLFRVLLPWLADHRLFLPLGGTSNHFRREALDAVGGWDPFNVTEDADIATRIYRCGGRIGTIASVTQEEAPLTWRAWHAQRTRWMKGWMQTWLVHGCQPVRLWSELGGINFCVFQALIMGQVLASLVYPIGLCLMAAVATGYLPMFDDRPFELDLVLALHLVATLAGWLGAVLCMARAWAGSSPGVRFADALLVPVYWLLHFAAVGAAFVELLQAPHRWNKTRHGIARRQQAVGRHRQ